LAHFSCGFVHLLDKIEIKKNPDATYINILLKVVKNRIKNKKLIPTKK
jgi:hypothetical protein